MRPTLILLVALIAACSRGPDAPAADSATPPREDVVTSPPPPPSPLSPLDGTGAGCLRLRLTVEQVGAACAVLSDTMVQGSEGMMERELRVRVGEAAVTARVTDGTVSRVIISDPQWRTPESLGVGSELDDLLARPGARAIEGEGRLFVTIPSRCGLSFRLDAQRGTYAGTTDELVRTVLQRNTLVDQVIVYGCAA